VHRLDDSLEEVLGGGMRKIRGAPPSYDGIAELWWESEEAFRGGGRTRDGREAGRLLLEDEARFIDLGRSPLWLNREKEIFPGGAKVST
jgi:hypothetical protein